MPHWLIKAGIQKTISLFPYSNFWNSLFQRYVTKGTILTAEWFEHKVEQCKQHIAHYASNTTSTVGIPTTCLEVGTGWHPIIPIGMFLSGSHHIYTIDISSLLNHDTVSQTVEFYAQYARDGKLQILLPSSKEDRIEKLMAIEQDLGSNSVESILSSFGIKPLVQDIRTIRLADESVDLITSNNTFEHIHADVFPGMLDQMHRVLRSSGVMSHFIDMSDHFSHFDTSISNYNFLKYSEKKWRLLDSPIVPQNRMRISDHLELHRNHQFHIIDTTVVTSAEHLPNNLTLDTKFKHYPLEELLVAHAWVVSRK